MIIAPHSQSIAYQSASANQTGVSQPQGAPLPQAPFVPPTKLSSSKLDELLKAATSNPTGRWNPGTDIASARNKHTTNRYDELHEGLAGPWDWLEVDVRMLQGEPVASHDEPDHRSLWMSDWIRVGAASERGLKLDFKERDAIWPTLDLVERNGVDQSRLIINVPAGDGGVPPGELQTIRSKFPESIINLSPNATLYSPGVIDAMVGLAKQVGGPIMFPLNAMFVTPRVVEGFKRGGRVAIWNNPTVWRPRDVAKTTARLRSWGVDGMIDLRR